MLVYLINILIRRFIKLMMIGYARVSTQDQNLDLQIDALKKAGCEKIYQEQLSASLEERPKLSEMVSNLRKGDTIVVWKLDRLARSLKHLLTLVSDFKTAGIGFLSLQDQINTTTAQGRLIFNNCISCPEPHRRYRFGFRYIRLYRPGIWVVRFIGNAVFTEAKGY